MRKKINTAACCSIVVIMSFAVIRASAQERQPTDDDVNVIAKQLYCPVCENTPLDVCGTQACIDWRAEIRQKLIEGWSEEEIIQYFVDQHGMQVLVQPPAEGFYLFIYIVPPLILFMGILILMRAVRGWRKPVPVESPGLLPEEQDYYMTRMEDELRRRQDDA
jgi:cytochrome c-type biogenesis protein CcmH